MKQSGRLNPSEETGTGCTVTSKYGKTPPNKHGGVGGQQQQPYGRGILQSCSHDCLIGSHECSIPCVTWSEVTSGIPQGNAIGPLMLSIFINDLPLSITSYIEIFADDTKIYNNLQDSGILKNDLDKLVVWCKEWLLPFNIDKCNILPFG